MSQPNYARYTVPYLVFLDLAAAILLGQKRSFHHHAQQMMTGIQPRLCVLGEENIPKLGPGVITVNHYSRTGFWSPWFSAAISAQVTSEIYWTMAEAWTYPKMRLGRWRHALSRALLTRVAGVYGFNTMPPMPPQPDQIAERAASIQRLMAYVRAHPQALLGISPEGGDQPGGVLTLPPDGFGKLAIALARHGLLFYPAGVFEDEGCFCLQFGQPYRLNISETANRSEADRLARWEVMCAIARCLPERLRGVFA